MKFISELIQLIKLLFSGKPKDVSEIIIMRMKYFPFSNYLAMSWCGKLIINSNVDKIDKSTYNHEMIHLKQSQQYGSWIGYYWKYLMEWLKGQPFRKPFNSAYYTNPFEVEAYANQNDENYWQNYNPENISRYYLKDRRKLFAQQNSFNKWLQYIRKLG